MSEKATSGLLRSLQEKIRTRMNDEADAIATGACQDFADYRYRTGIVQGLAMVERDLLDLDQRVKVED